MAPRLRRNWWTVLRYHWTVRKGSLPSSRRAAIRLSRLMPNRCFPSATPPKSTLGTRRFSHTGQVLAMKTCSVTWTGTTGRSMTSRVRWVHPPDRPVPHWRQASKTCSTRWVGVVRWRAKPWGRGFLGPFSLGVCWRPDLGLMPGIPLGPPGFGLSLQRLYPPLQLGDDGLLLLNDSLQLGNQGQQVLPRHGAQVNVGIHASDLT